MAETKLRVVSTYRNRDIQYSVGDVITVDEALAKWLRADAPGCFEDYIEKAPTAPPMNKMIESAPKRKTTRKGKAN